MNRRTFMTAAAGCCAVAALPALPAGAADGFPARFWEPGANGNVSCGLCPWECIITPGKRGTCGTRENRQGRLVTLAYANPCSLNIDPIEKKPFFHVLPGEQAFSLATGGCNLACAFCQNWQIARERPDRLQTRPLTPVQAAEEARSAGCRAVAFTYSEPVVFYEYMVDTARAAREAGISPLVVSNGFISRQPLLELCPHIDACKIDLKSFSDSYYRDVCGGRLQPVLDTLQTLRQQGVWLEIVYLVVPARNDSVQEVRAMAEWVRTALGQDVPVHLTRFHPAYRMTRLPATPVLTLERLHTVVKESGIRYAYIGNVPGHKAAHTYCHNCGSLLIERKGYTAEVTGLAGGRCSACGAAIPGFWQA